MRTQSVSSPEDQNVTFVELFFDLVIAFLGLLAVAVVEQRAEYLVPPHPRE